MNILMLWVSSKQEQYYNKKITLIKTTDVDGKGGPKSCKLVCNYKFDRFVTQQYGVLT